MISHPGRSLDTRGYQGVEDVGRTGHGEQFASASGERTVSDHHVGAGQDDGQPSLACCSSPGLGDHGGGHNGTLASALRHGERRPGVSVSTVESDENSKETISTAFARGLAPVPNLQTSATRRAPVHASTSCQGLVRSLVPEV
jgi:hypothetical protein